MPRLANIKKVFQMLALIACQVAALAQEHADSTYVKTQTLGPFALGAGRLVSVYARVTHVHLRSENSDGWPDSDTLLVVLDSSGRELYKQSAYTTLGGAETEFGCSQVKIPTLGQVLECTTSISPTVASDGESVQLFGINSKQEFVPIAPILPRFEYRIVFLDSRTRQKPITVDHSLPYAKPAIEVQHWTGWYPVKVYYYIYPEGYSLGQQRRLFHFEEIPISIDSGDLDAGRHYNEPGDTLIFLYPTPDTNRSRAQSVTIKPSSKIRCLYASFVHDWWLFISIDGHEGYVTGDDCRKLGCPATDATPMMLEDDY